MSGLYKKEDLVGMPVLVLGISMSGVSAARLLKKFGADIFISEKSGFAKVQEYIKVLEDEGIRYETGGHDLNRFVKPDFVVVSPGIPLTAPVILELIETGCPIYSEIEVASWFYEGKVVAVTGSNGKTTVTSWIDHLLKGAGKKSEATGNIGYPFCDLIREKPETEFAVVEVSSYQLETIKTFRPDIAILTNITPDHLERHGSMKEYARVKSLIWENQNFRNSVILNENSELIRNITSSIKCEKLTYSIDDIENEEDNFITTRGKSIEIKSKSRYEKLIETNEIMLKGSHNLENALMVAAVGIVLEIEKDDICRSLRSFRGVEHRLEVVANNGRLWINDSKATNVDSLRVALNAVEGPIWLIAGGTDKGDSYEPLRDLVQERVKKLLLIGDGAKRFEDELGDIVEVAQCETLDNAVKLATIDAEKGSKILLSPGCASFDQFKNFEERGKRFKELVQGVVIT
jgi:UDP-N-acetylmuramoylalanine--D-glutamate ligase